MINTAKYSLPPAEIYKIVCEDFRNFSPKNEDGFFSSKQKFVRALINRGEFIFAPCRVLSFFGVKKFLKDEQTTF
jgi:hypothetical protein